MIFTENHLTWLYKQARGARTKAYIRELEKEAMPILGKDKFAIIRIKQKFPLNLGRWKIWLNEENSFYSLKTYTGIFKDRDHTKMTKFPAKSDLVIVDLGANEGFYTLKAREMAPKAKIIAVEPNPSAFRTLKRNVTSNKLRNIIIMNKAITSRIGKISFEIIKGQTSIGGLKVYEKYRKRGKLKKIIVDSITLEKLCKLNNVKNMDLLKMDVEGSELDILKNSENILPCIKKVVVEYHEAQKTKKPVIAIMLRNGFRIALIDREKYYGNLYFIKR
jgi:FkbM family methyltransferase